MALDTTLYRHALLIGILAGTGAAQTLAAGHTSSLAPGTAAPEVRFTATLQGPGARDISLNGLRGQVVVLEFWATWCGPCVAEIPHLNQLADAFAGKVQFIAIDDETSAMVRKFMTTHPMHSWIARGVR